jgi:hypothetical protein
MRAVAAILAFSLPVFAAAQAATWIEVSGGRWHPTAEQLGDAEAALRLQLPSAAKNRGTIAKWSDYRFQYQGRSTALGRKFIYVNAFCNDWGTGQRDLARQWLEVDDGGACYFNAKYDPEQRHVYDLIVNGVA